MKDKPYTLVVVDLSEEERQMLINHAPQCGDLLSPPPTWREIWPHSILGWTKLIAGTLLTGALAYILIVLMLAM